MSPVKPFALLFVCLGNICRSPTAEGVFRQRSENRLPHLNLTIDSAGTSAYHLGEKPDPRTIRAAQKRGYDLTQLRARQVTAKDFDRFDLLIAMDSSNYQNLLDMARCTGNLAHIDKVKLFLDYSPSSDIRDIKDVPDPYYGGIEGFDRVIDLIESSSNGLIEQLGLIR